MEGINSFASFLAEHRHLRKSLHVTDVPAQFLTIASDSVVPLNSDMKRCIQDRFEQFGRLVRIYVCEHVHYIATPDLSVVEAHLEELAPAR